MQFENVNMTRPRYCSTVLLLVGLLTIQTGCRTLTKADCDPSIEKDVITKTRCLGLYEERVGELQLSLEEQKALNADLQTTLAAVQKEQNEIAVEVKNKQQEYAQLNAAVNSLMSKLKAKSAQNTGLKRSINEIEAKLAQVNQPQPDDASTLQKKQQLDELRQQLGALQKELGN